MQRAAGWSIAWALALPGLAGAPTNAAAQAAEPPSPAPVVTLHPGLLLVAGGAWGPDEASPRELYVGEARVLARGVVAPPGADPDALDGTAHFAYFLQLQTLAAPAVLDARITAELHPALRLDAGLTKIPISDEWLIPAPFTDFGVRSRAVRALSPRRGVGVQLGGHLAAGAFAYVLGVYDQNTPLGQDDIPPIYAARVDGHLDLAPAALAIGAGGGLRPGTDDTDRETYADLNARFEWGPLFAATEALYAAFDPPPGSPATGTVSIGGFGTLGYDVTDTIQLLARYDHLTTGDLTDAAVVAAVGWSPLEPVLIQLDYDHPVQGDAPQSLSAYGQLYLVW